jgi:hypothetical protein
MMCIASVWIELTRIDVPFTLTHTRYMFLAFGIFAVFSGIHSSLCERRETNKVPLTPVLIPRYKLYSLTYLCKNEVRYTSSTFSLDSLQQYSLACTIYYIMLWRNLNLPYPRNSLLKS